ncbi:MAG: HNH endonuclease [Nitrososphaera sp.]
MKCVGAGGIRLQQGMNYRPKGFASVFLRNSSAYGKYPDTFLEGKTIIYEGHDVPQQKSGTDSRKIDQQLRNKDGSLTANGLFYEAAQLYKDGRGAPEIIQVYEKKMKGEWVDRGLYKLIDAYPDVVGVRTVYKFKLEPIVRESVSQVKVVSEDDFADAIRSGNIDLVKEVLTSESRASSSLRNGQAALRKLTRARYSNQCALCDVGEPELLVASHIIPWSMDEACRGALANVICFCSLHDRLFEEGRIIIDDNYDVIFSEKFLNECSRSKAYKAFRGITNKTLRMPSSEPPNMSFLHRHRTSFN